MSFNRNPEPSRQRSELYGLLYLDNSVNLHVNLKTRSSPIEIYARCAATLCASAKSNGESFTLITNSPKYISTLMDTLGLEVPRLLEIPFDLSFPKDIPFYQAHFKLCVIKAFAQNIATHSTLVDLDAVILKPLSTIGLLGDALGAYDISSQEYPLDLKSTFCPNIDSPRWFGGEFISGNQSSFKALWDEISTILPVYIDRLSRQPIPFRHIGDETVVSAALNQLEAKGSKIYDIGANGGITRWWSARTDWPQISLSQAMNSAILHLPSDKPFLATQSSDFTTRSFASAYCRYVKPKLARRRLLNLPLNILKRQRKFVGSI